MTSSRPPQKACAAGAVLGKLKKRVKGSGPYHVCLTPSQKEKLFGSGPINTAIGCGTFACVFPRRDGRVVKLTKDREDIEGFISSKGLKHVVRIDEIHEMPTAGLDLKRKRPVPVYAMVAERLRPWTSSEQRWINKPLDKARTDLLRTVKRYRGSARSFDLPSGEVRSIARASCARAPKKRVACEKFIGEFVDTFAELFRHGVLFQDSHPGNFGFDKDGRWKILDLGYSGIRERRVVPVLAAPQLRRRRRRR